MGAPTKVPGSGAEGALIVLGGGVVVAGLATYAGARLGCVLGGGSVGGGLGIWVAVAFRLLGGSSPSAAWGEHGVDVPGGLAYWIPTALCMALGVALVAGAVILWRRLDDRDERRRFGQPTDARQARPNDVRPLTIEDVVPPTGRMLLGRMAPKGPLLATEDRQRHPLAGRLARRQGHRGSVALIGPTGSGKTALATSAIATWDGPVVAVSVKRDLYDTTVAARSRVGDVAVFDPGGATGLPTARWSPLESTTTSSGALRTGRALAQAIPKGSVTNADYWAEHGEALLGAFMCVAGLARLLTDDDGRPIHRVGMEQLAAWVRTLATSHDPVINDLVRRAVQDHQPLEVKLLGRHASVTFVGMAKEDHKIRSSVYSTAVLALKPWLEPSVAHSASAHPNYDYAGSGRWEQTPRYVDLQWLMSPEKSTSNTLYLAAPTAEFERLSPVLGGLLAEIKDSIHAWDIAGEPLKKPLLIVIDEAAQLQLDWLPTEVSTIAALGAFFVTCWQNLAQINHRYGTLADAVLSGHRTKCFFAGVDDPATTRYLSGLLGDELVARRGWSSDIPTMWGTRHGGRRSVSESVQREQLAPASTLRQMFPGEAVLIHGTLPPVHLDAIRWWREPELAELIPADAEGKAIKPDDLATCPLTAEAASCEPEEVIDKQTLRALRDQLPVIHMPTSRDDGSERAGEAETDAPGQARIVRAICEICQEPLAQGEAREVRRSGRVTICCSPSCSDRHRSKR